MIARCNGIVAHLVHGLNNALAIHESGEGCSVNSISTVQYDRIRIFAFVAVDEPGNFRKAHLAA
ncbi:hypothetical protein D3C80_1747310 [compost metagenome]